MSFNFWSLDYVYYPISGILWIWHKIFGYFLGYSNAWSWVLSVMFLVFTLRAVMFKPFMKQMDSSLAMQALQPEMKRLRAKYKDDRQRLTEEMMKLNKEHGVNTLASCLPALMQAPAFLGLFHVLRNFIKAYNNAHGMGEEGETFVSNYFLPQTDVESFHDAVMFGGAALSGHLTMSDAELSLLNADRETMLWVGIPLMFLAAIATHLTSRKSVARQSQLGQEQTGQMAIMQKLMLWGFPLAVFVIGWLYPLALLFYWLANNTWTFLQLWVGHRMQDRKKAAAALVVEAEIVDQSYTKPKPGARPDRPKIAPAQSSGAQPDEDSAIGSTAPATRHISAGTGSLEGFLPPGAAAPRTPKPGTKPAQRGGGKGGGKGGSRPGAKGGGKKRKKR